MLDSFNSETGSREDGILDIDRRLADYGLGLGAHCGYPKPHGMVAKRLIGCDNDLVIGIRPTETGLDILLVGGGEHANDAIERWALPPAEGMEAVDEAIDQIIHAVSEKIRPYVGLSVSPQTGTFRRVPVIFDPTWNMSGAKGRRTDIPSGISFSAKPPWRQCRPPWRLSTVTVPLLFPLDRAA
ncbi:hypothetical protein [Rhizobium leguminosarum]|uniref:Uncharacterized protein n=1 Tax=Rhizobium leguminosarum TaxID=384 RepID=A0A6P0DGW4_RHILE|nr:hypothetical protein [Rhizobium leguminosarum]NEK52208.1 hypothetical protein [Rhizobium leguminosarum]WFT86857.1 hypothetical protein QA638_04360 [Rhizobium leguminosarum]